MNAKIFLVDDERTIRLTFRTALETDGYTVEEAATADEAAMGFRAERYDLVILDLRIGEDNGLQVLERMRAAGVRTPTLMITAYGRVRDAVRAMKLGAIDFLEKPIEPGALRAVVADILARHQPAPADEETEEAWALTPAPHDRLTASAGLEPEPETDPAGLVREAKRLVNLQAFADAEALLDTFFQHYPPTADARHLRGVLHEIRGDHEQARQAYAEAVRLDGQHEGARQNLRRLGGGVTFERGAGGKPAPSPRPAA